MSSLKTSISIGNHKVLRLICTSVCGINSHECVFQNLKLHEPLQRVQFEIFEKLTSVFPNCTTAKPYGHALIIYLKKFTEELNNPKYQGHIIF